MIRAFVFILYFFLAIPLSFAQTVDTLQTKDTIVRPIKPERVAKNKTLYQRIRNYLRSHKVTKNLDHLIVVEEHTATGTTTSATGTTTSATVTSTIITTSPNPLKKSSYQGKIIRNIVITTLDPFGFDERDLSKQPSNRWERYGNALHIKTREGTVRRQLLFKQHTALDTLLLSESERLLRNQRYVRRVVIEAVPTSMLSDSVDVKVNVLDAWTMYFDGDLTGSRGWTRLSERNLFGLGHEASVTYQQSFSGLANNGKGFSYALRNIRNSYINVRAAYYNDYHNYFSKSIHINRPLYSPLARWSGNLSYYEMRDIRTEREFNEPIEAPSPNYEPTYLNKSFNAFGSWVTPLQKSYNNHINSFIVGINFRNTSFYRNSSERPDTDAYYGNENILLTQFSLNSSSFAKDRYIFRNGDIEDVSLGHSVFLTSGMVWRYGKLLPYLSVGGSNAYYSKKRYYSIGLEMGSFVVDGGLKEIVIRGDATHFTRLFNIGGWHFREFLKASFSVGLNEFVYQPKRISLNEPYGIAGFHSDMLEGTRKLMITSQTQIYAPFQLIGFRISPFLSADLGFIGQGRIVLAKPDLYSKFSVGFYITNDYLPFGAIQFSFAYYPTIPNVGKNIFKITGDTNDDFRLRSFSQRIPGVIPFR
nr:hypothetical protein [uncultured Capnocytophaga sp.]